MVKKKLYVKTIIVYLVSMISLNSCLVVQNSGKMAKVSIIKYGDNTELINDRQFYVFKVDVPSSNGKTISYMDTNRSILFHPDMSVCYFSLYDDSLLIYDVCESLEKCVNTWGFQKEQWGNMWGVYQKKDSIIHTEMYEKYTLWRILKDEFVMRGDTLILRNRTYYDSKGKVLKEYDDLGANYLFYPAKNIPPQANHFLKKEKWIWRNVEDWKAYMDSQKK